MFRDRRLRATRAFAVPVAAAVLLAVAPAAPATPLPAPPVASSRIALDLDGPSQALGISGWVKAPVDAIGMFSIVLVRRSAPRAAPHTVYFGGLHVFGTPVADGYAVGSGRGLCPAPLTCSFVRRDSYVGFSLSMGAEGSRDYHGSVYLLAQGTFHGVKARLGRWRMSRPPAAFAFRSDVQDSAARVDLPGSRATASAFRVTTGAATSFAVASAGCERDDRSWLVLDDGLGTVRTQACPAEWVRVLAPRPTTWTAVPVVAHGTGRVRPAFLLVVDL